MPKQLLLIVGGGIAAYKTPEFVRRARDAGYAVRCILTQAGAQFVTPLALASVLGDKVYTDLFSLTDEHEMGHIRLARDPDLIVVAPATADFMAKAAMGLADDLASTVMVATDKPVMFAPAMNPAMWQAKPTQRNLAQLQADGALFVGPNAGDMACGEEGAGRMAEPLEIVAAIDAHFSSIPKPLAGWTALVTSGPTHEPIDPVRYIANRSSGKQGHAIAAQLAAAGAQVTLVSGPVAIADPPDVRSIKVETAQEMAAACAELLPVDIAVCAAAVADWRPNAVPGEKIKKEAGGTPAISLTENPDILQMISTHRAARPKLVIGFAAETGDLINKARRKRARKGCDWIVANDVAGGDGVFGSDVNRVVLIDETSEIAWPEGSKMAVAERLVEKIKNFFAE